MRDDNLSLSKDERRQYFRVLGVVYLHLERKKDRTETPSEKLLPETLDEIEIKLFHFRQKLAYNPPQEEYWEEVIDILGDMHRARKTPLATYERKSVIISGSSI